MAAIFFDIDGTLWDKENHIPQSTKDAIRQLRNSSASGERTSDLPLQWKDTRVYQQ